MRREAEALVPLTNEEQDHALWCLSEVARRIAAMGCLKGFRNPDVRHAVQMVNINERQATCKNLYEEIHATRRSAKGIFEEACGESPAVFLTQRKMMRAEDLLMNTNESVRTISGLLGYDLYSFTRFFKRHCGDTPGHFRRYGAEDDVAGDEGMGKDTVPFRNRVPKDDKKH